MTQVAGLEAPEGNAELLLWGAPVKGGNELQTDLIAICDELGEDPLRRSEPDVVVAWPRDLAFMEVKYQAPNDVKPSYRNFRSYTTRADIFALPADQVAAASYYELVRNWRIGVGLAERVGGRFALINVGPRRLSRSDARSRRHVQDVAASRLRLRLLVRSPRSSRHQPRRPAVA